LSSSLQMAASMLALILSSCKFTFTWESCSSGPSCWLMWSLHFLFVCSFHSQGSYEPILAVPLPRPSPRPLILSSPSPEEDSKAAGGVPRRVLICWASSIAEAQGSRKFTLSRESPSSGPSRGLTWSLHFLVILLLTAKAHPCCPPPSFLPRGKEGSEK